MSETADRVPVACPSCSPGEATVHEVLKPGGQMTVRCTECGHVHKEQIERPETAELDVVVSQGGESLTATVESPAAESIAVGEEFIVDTAEAIMQVRVTSIEVGVEQRVDEATARDVDTVWTRAVDNVSVGVTIHPKDGRVEDTRSVTMQVPGDYEFVVGETEEAGNESFEIEGLQVRSDVDGYRREKFDHDGDMVFAKDLKRVYARDDQTSAWSAW